MQNYEFSEIEEWGSSVINSLDKHADENTEAPEGK